MGALKGHLRPRKGQKEGCPDPLGLSSVLHMCAWNDRTAAVFNQNLRNIQERGERCQSRVERALHRWSEYVSSRPAPPLIGCGTLGMEATAFAGLSFPSGNESIRILQPFQPRRQGC